MTVSGGCQSGERLVARRLTGLRPAAAEPCLPTSPPTRKHKILPATADRQSSIHRVDVPYPLSHASGRSDVGRASLDLKGDPKRTRSAAVCVRTPRALTPFRQSAQLVGRISVPLHCQRRLLCTGAKSLCTGELEPSKRPLRSGPRKSAANGGVCTPSGGGGEHAPGLIATPAGPAGFAKGSWCMHRACTQACRASGETLGRSKRSVLCIQCTTD